MSVDISDIYELVREMPNKIRFICNRKVREEAPRFVGGEQITFELL